MKAYINLSIIALCLSFTVFADDLHLKSVSYGYSESDKNSIIDVLRFEFNTQDFDYQIEIVQPTLLRIIFQPVGEGIKLFNTSGKTSYTPPSQKIAGVFFESESESRICIKISLKSNYLYEPEKSGKIFFLKIYPEKQPRSLNEAGGKNDNKPTFEQKYERWENKLKERQDFFYRGFALITLNYASIEGNAFSYSNGIFEYDKGFSSRQKLSFLGDGRIFDDYYLTVQAFYDPLDDSGFDYKPISNLYFFAKLEKGLNYISIGDHDKETFTDLHLNRYTQSFLGTEAHFETEWASATAFAAISKGGVEVQEFQADNTTGPIQLSHTPIVIGSEFITIEERDKNSTTRIVNTSAQTRGVDYFINYEEGEITFVTPVPKETFNRNPNYIVIRYQYERAGAGKEYVTAAQFQVMPLQSFTIGATYMNKFSDGGFDSRDEVFGLNAGFDAGEPLKAFAEFAYNNKAGSDEPGGGAYYLQMQGRLGEKLQYRGSYQKIDDDFLNIANSRLKFYSNQLRIDGETLYSLNEYNTFILGYRSEETNINHSEGNPSVMNSSLYGQWQMNYPFIPAFTLRYDLISRSDDLPENERSIDFKSRELTVNAEKYLGIFGETGLMAIYRLTAVDDKTGTAGDSRIDLYGAKIINRPLDGLSVYAEYRFETGDLTGGSGAPADYIILGLGGRLTPFADLNLDIMYEDRDRKLKSTDEKESEEDIISVGGSYLISSSLRLMGRYEERDFTNFLNSSNNQQSSTANVRFFVNPVSNLRFGLGYEMEDRYIASSLNNHSYEDRLLLELSYKKEKSLDLYARYQLDLNEEEFPPLPVTTAENNINLVGLRFWIGDKFDFLGRYKKQRITGADDNTLDTLTLEAGYQLLEDYKFILGFETAKFEHPTLIDDNYEANNLYLRLVAVF